MDWNTNKMVSSGAMYVLSSTASSPSSSILYSLRDSRQSKSLNADCVRLEKIKRQLVECREAAKTPARNKPALPSVPLAKILHHLLSKTSLIIDQGSHISCKWATRYLNRKDVEYDSSKEMRTTQVCEECRRSVGRSLWVECERKKICGSKWGPCKRERS